MKILCKKCNKESEHPDSAKGAEVISVACPHCKAEIDKEGSLVSKLVGDMAPQLPELIKRDLAKRVSQFVKIEKVDDEKQLIYGIVYEPDVVDSQGDYADAGEIEKACHNFMENYQNMSLMHKELVNEDVKIVECSIAQADFTLGVRAVKKGTWILVSHVISKDIWKEVKSGKLTGYSLEGSARSIEKMAKAADDNDNVKKIRQLIDLVVTAVALVDSPANKKSFNLLKRDVNELFDIANLTGLVGSLKSAIEWMTRDNKLGDAMVQECLKEIADLAAQTMTKGGGKYKCPVKDIDAEAAEKVVKEDIAKKDGEITILKGLINDLVDTLKEVGGKIVSKDEIQKMLGKHFKDSKIEMQNYIKTLRE